jgi:hypothetical protein
MQFYLTLSSEDKKNELEKKLWHRIPTMPTTRPAAANAFDGHPTAF